MLLLTALACFSRPVPGVPDQAVKIAVTPTRVSVDGTAVGEFSVLEANPVDEDVPDVRLALDSFEGRPAWIELPGDSGFFIARKLINAARRAGLDPVVLSVTGGKRAYPVQRAPSYALGGPCPEGPQAIAGTQPLVTVWIQSGRAGSWLLGEVRHLPLVGEGTNAVATDFLEDACLQKPDCDALYSGERRRKFCTSDPGPQEVRLGGDVSACLVPIARQPADAAEWPEGLARHIERLGLAKQPLTKVVPEAQTPVAAVVATLEGFRTAKAPIPAVPTRLLFEGNDGPLACTAPSAVIQTAQDLEDSGARYLGSLLMRKKGSGRIVE
ncbi:MAG: hypothetical protein AAGA48_25105 [Myxococcota bacterium]